MCRGVNGEAPSVIFSVTMPKEAPMVGGKLFNGGKLKGELIPEF